MRSSYWSCSKFAERIRGTNKPLAGTSEEWHEWNARAKNAHPVRYWIAEELLDGVKDVLMWVPDQLHSLKYYINNRWVTRTHALTAHPQDIRPGDWQDIGYRFLPCMFNELVNYVEVELAWWHIAWSERAERQKYDAPFWATGWFRWRTWRCARAGIDNLRWQQNLTSDWLPDDHPDRNQPAPQAERAREILELYNWWTQIRPYRINPEIQSGWAHYCDATRLEFLGKKKSEQEEAMVSAMIKDMHNMEEAHEQEDEDMLIRLIKIRRALWV